MTLSIYNIDGTIDYNSTLITPEIAVKRPNLATVVVDMQPNFIEHLSIHDEYRTISRTKKVLDFCVKQDIPIIIVESVGDKKTISELLNVASTSKSAKIYQKQSTGAFDSSIIPNILKSYGVRELFFAGINATSCVLRSMVNAQSYGLRVMTADDVIANGSNVITLDYATEGDLRCIQSHKEIRRLYEEKHKNITYFNSYKDFINLLQKAKN